MSSELIVMTFQRPNQAETVLEAIRAMRKSPVLCLSNIVVATQDDRGRITLRPGQEPAAAQQSTDMQILLALADRILCAPAQDAIDALAGKGMDRRFLSEIARRMEGESSALLILTREDSIHDAGETRSTLALFKGRVHQTSLLPEVETYLLTDLGSSDVPEPNS
jgi:uncharacterized membrane protein